VLAAVAALFVAFRPADGPVRRGRAVVGEPAPGFTTIDLEGNRVTLAEYRGKVVLINFWASWCVPCRREFPVLKRFLADHPDVRLLGVTYQDSRADASRFMAEQGATWQALEDPGDRIAASFGAGLSSGLPQTWVVDGDGVVRGRHGGEAVRADLDELVRLALGARPAPS
jgi:cytochrome c biogenesis protein CcmG, thiol:disulfide interchange protein DsbE